MSRINISFSPEIQSRADELIREGGYTGLSDLLKCLVREEYRRVMTGNNPRVINVAPADAAMAELTDKAAVIQEVRDASSRTANKSPRKREANG